MYRNLSALLLIASAIPAQAQVFGGDKPIKVIAEKATYEGGLTILVGNVDVKQGTARIQSDTMNIYRAEVTVLMRAGTFATPHPTTQSQVTGGFMNEARVLSPSQAM